MFCPFRFGKCSALLAGKIVHLRPNIVTNAVIVCRRTLATEATASVNELIKGYFHHGYPYQALVGLLEKHDGVRMHVRTLKRKLRDLGLKRKVCNHDEDTVRELVKQEMQGAGSLAGYRYIWHALRLRHHVNVPRSQVASIMKDIDPEGVQERRSRRLRRRAYVSYGPNFCWHVDGRCKFGYNSHYPTVL